MMNFVIDIQRKTAGERSGEVLTIRDPASSASAEIWPEWGFNCLAWHVPTVSHGMCNLLYSSPEWERAPVPTRNGHPILFPFPGRMQNGQMLDSGTIYQLPRNDSTGRHAIHGFTPRNRWRVIDQTCGLESGSVTAEFHLAEFDPEFEKIWPSDFRIAVTYTLRRNALEVLAVVTNLGPRLLPFGLGYHGYFRLPGSLDTRVDDYQLRTSAQKHWNSTIDQLPDGTLSDVSSELNFQDFKSVGSTQLDHVLTKLNPAGATNGQLFTLAELRAPNVNGRLIVAGTTAFRELVLFTPPHRQAIAIEPYTCSADAARLAAQGFDSGWLTIAPGSEWTSTVVYSWIDGQDFHK